MFKSASGAGGFYTHQIANSCRFKSATSDALSLTFGTSTDLSKFTFSCWVKRSLTHSNGGNTNWQNIIGNTTGVDGGGAAFGFESGGGTSGGLNNRDRIAWYGLAGAGGGSNGGDDRIEGYFYDTSAWYHIVVRVDTSLSAATKIRYYVNGDIKVRTTTNEPTGDMSRFNTATAHYIGALANGNYDLDGYLAEVVFCDGQSLGPDSFGETKNGAWIPSDPSGLTFGTNGFYLKFADSSALGKDSSGNDNDWTVVNLAAHDQMLDSPTFNSDSNGGNFCTYNPLTPVGLSMDLMALSEGNLHAQSETADKYSQAIGNMGVKTGKWYLEFFIEVAGYPSWAVGWHSGSQLGRFDGDVEAANADLAYMGYFTGNNVYITNFGNTATGDPQVAHASFTNQGAPTTGDVIMCAMDFDAGKGWWGMNGQWGNVGAGTGNPATGANASATWTASSYADYKFPHTLSWADADGEIMLNAGQDGTFAGNISAGGNADDTGYGNFKYDVPAGFLALCTGNLPVSEDVDPAETSDNFPQKLFNPYIYTGNATDNRNLTGMGFQPDWCWIKDRNSDEGHQVYDSSRGVEKRIQTNTNGAEEATSDKFQAFLSDGFQVGASNDTNKNASGFVNWSWKINGGTTVTNTAGSIDTTVQVNAAAGISIVQWAGGGGAATFGHGLGVAPSFVTAKSRTASAALMDWPAMHKNMGAAGAFPGDNTRMYFNSPDEFGGGTLWIPSQNSTTVFGVSGANINDSGKSYVAYCFAEVEGYSKFGHYEGNGNADGSFVYTGFSPALVICKSSDSGSDWQMFDNKRLGYNVDNNEIQGNDSTAEATTDMIDLLSNGFKHRIATDPNVAESYIYLAWADNPFKYSTAR